jgi:beta-phosphoglucomutase-like phosphatase (HAD superfamily)
VSGKPAAILDIDGTLVDTNYHHALAWYRAFLQSGKVLPVWRIHRHIGMGGDQLVAADGFSEAELRQAGASSVFASLSDLLAHLDATRLS